MKIFADESVDGPIVSRLRSDGHEVIYAAELAPCATDDVVLAEANARAVLLLTADKDFGELVFRLRRVHVGVVLIRLSGLAPTAKAELLARMFRDHGQRFDRAFCVISRRAMRIRPSP